MNNNPFMCSVRDTIHFKQMVLATEKTYCYWIRFFIRHHNYSSPGEIKGDDVTAFLTYLAVSRRVSPNTQNQAFNALLFLFRHVLNMPQNSGEEFKNCRGTSRNTQEDKYSHLPPYLCHAAT